MPSRISGSMRVNCGRSCHDQKAWPARTPPSVMSSSLSTVFGIMISDWPISFPRHSVKISSLLRTVEFRDLIELVDSERVRVIVVRVQAAGIEQRFRIFLPHRVGNRHSAAERVEAPAQVLTSTQIFDAEPPLASEQPQKHRRRMPI